MPLRRHSFRRLAPAMLLALVLAGLSACANGPRFASLGATVVPAAPLDLPPDAELIVRLEDVTRPGANVVAEGTYTRLGRGPIPVMLRYDANAIDDEHAYALRAEIRVDGKLTHTNADEVAVLTGDAPDNHVSVPIEATGR